MYSTESKKQKLRKIQNRIAKKVILEDEFSKPIKTIAGFDLAFLDDEEQKYTQRYRKIKIVPTLKIICGDLEKHKMSWLW